MLTLPFVYLGCPCDTKFFYLACTDLMALFQIIVGELVANGQVPTTTNQQQIPGNFFFLVSFFGVERLNTCRTSTFVF